VPYRCFCSQVAVSAKFFVDVEVELDASGGDATYLTEKVKEQVEILLEENMPAEWLDDVEMVVESIK
jgi:hypothetical protein